MTLQQVEDAISQSNANVGGDVLTLGSQSHNVRAIGLLGEGVDPLDPANADHAYAIEVEKLEDIQDVVVTDVQRHARSTSSRSPRWSIGYQPRLGIVGPGRRERRRRGHRPDAEVREVAADLRGGPGEDRGAQRRASSCPRG